LRRHRDVEQPLAGVVDDLDDQPHAVGELLHHPAAGAIVDHQAQAAQRARRLGPVAVALEHRGDRPAQRERRDAGDLGDADIDQLVGGGEAEEGQPRLVGLGEPHVLDQRGHEHGLAGAAEAGDAEADLALHDVAPGRRELAPRLAEDRGRGLLRRLHHAIEMWVHPSASTRHRRPELSATRAAASMKCFTVRETNRLAAARNAVSGSDVERTERWNGPFSMA
jgi:hypothetical protein